MARKYARSGRERMPVGRQALFRRAEEYGIMPGHHWPPAGHRGRRGMMDRIDAMKVFVTALEEGSLAGAGRKLGRSPAAVSRAIAFLEAHVGAELLHRTTRSIKLSEVGERYAAVCRRVLTELEEADNVAAGDRAAPR